MLIKAGHKEDARTILNGIVLSDLDNVRAWAMLALAAENEADKIQALQEVLRLKPGDEWASKQLKQLQPVVSQEKVAGQTTQETAVRKQPKRVDISEDFSKYDKTIKLLAGFAAFAVLILVIWGSYTFIQSSRSYPDDPEKAMQAARTWFFTTSQQEEYELMTDAVCSSKQEEAQRIAENNRRWTSFVNIAPPPDISFELIRIKGNDAVVEISNYQEFLSSVHENKLSYMMKREGTDWKWCGEYDDFNLALKFWEVLGGSTPGQDE